MTTVIDAIRQVLEKAGEPLHYREITRRIVESGLWESSGKTPEATVNAQLATHIKNDGGKCAFVRTGRGIFGLRAHASHPASPKGTHPARTLSFTDAAEKVLREHANGKPLHYEEITKIALAEGLVRTQGLTPKATMYAQIFQECQRWVRRGQKPRFDRRGKGIVGLTAWQPVGIPAQIERQNEKVRTALHKQLLSLMPAEFEALIGRLLAALGFDDVTVTNVSGDGGIDVRGTLVVGEVIRTRMAVQAKRWKQNVQAPTVQQVRGSLGAHEQGLIITTSDFSKGANTEANRPDATPVGLMNGKTLVALLVEHGIGVRRSAYDLLELGETEDEE